VAVVHLVAHLALGRRDLAEFELAQRVWEGMKAAFPAALAAMVIPDHVHMAAEEDDPDGGRRRLARALSRASYGRGRGLWLPVPQPEVVREGKLRRVVRYVALNPCRRRLVGDPLAWQWSTYRDVMGVAVDPWVTDERLARALGERREGFRRRFHGYVTRDERVDVGARAYPEKAALDPPKLWQPDELALAVTSALRLPLDALRRKGTGPARKLLVALARTVRMNDTSALARLCGITPTAIRLMKPRFTQVELDAALLCLESERLRRH